MSDISIIILSGFIAMLASHLPIIKHDEKMVSLIDWIMIPIRRALDLQDLPGHYYE